MKILLDTHAFIWFIEGNKNLSINAKTAIESTDNHCFLSIASLWEMAIKSSLGKLQLAIELDQLINNHVYGNNFQLLAINTTALCLLQSLPFHHRDPFDRLIIAQAITNELTLLTKDDFIKSYNVNCLW